MSDDDESESDKTMIMSPSALKRQPAPKATLTCVDTSVLQGPGGESVSLDGQQVLFGRGAENDVVLQAEGISRAHAKFFPGDDVWGVEDLGSTNGVRVNNSKVHQAWLKSGDTVAIGRVCYKYVVDPAEDKTETTGSHQIDLADDKTMIMRPSAKAAAEEPTATATAAGAAAKPAAKPAARPAPAAKKGGSGTMLWVVVVIGIAALGAAVYLMM